MHPVASQNGADCFRCCVASLLNRPYDTVPDLMDPLIGDRYALLKAELDRMDDWFTGIGAALIRLPIPVFYPGTALDLIAASQPDVPYILTGLTKKGVGHSWIARRNRIVYDPATPAQPICEPFETGVFWAYFIGMRG